MPKTRSKREGSDLALGRALNVPHEGVADALHRTPEGELLE
jgi:hypothetical protein